MKVGRLCGHDMNLLGAAPVEPTMGLLKRRSSWYVVNYVDYSEIAEVLRNADLSHTHLHGVPTFGAVFRANAL